MKKKILIGCFDNRLDLAKAKMVQNKLSILFPKLLFEIQKIKKITILPDKYQEKMSLREYQVVYVEKLLLNKKFDIVVHSMKNFPQTVSDDLVFAAFFEREDQREVLISKRNLLFSELKKGSYIGTNSTRRIKSLTKLRKDLVYVPISGDILTRIEKLERYEYDAIMLTASDLTIIGLNKKISEYFDLTAVYPAPAQGILACQCRKEDIFTQDLLREINNTQYEIAYYIERTFLLAFDLGYNTPIGCFTVFDEDKITLHAAYYDEKKIYYASAQSSKEEYKNLSFLVLNDIQKKIAK